MELETIIGSYAFPIVMCLWFMFRTEKVITENTAATKEMVLILRAEQDKEKEKIKAS